MRREQIFERDAIHQQRDRDKDSQARVVYDQASNDRMEQSAKDSIQKPPVKESEALLASEIGTGTPSFRQWEH